MDMGMGMGMGMDMDMDMDMEVEEEEGTCMDEARSVGRWSGSVLYCT